MSDTPRCDAAENAEAWKDPQQWVTELAIAWGLARQLERELSSKYVSDIFTFAARCRPAVKAYLTKAEQAALKVGSTYPEHYRSILENDANTARKLLDEIDSIIGPVGPHEPPKVPGHFPVA